MLDPALDQLHLKRVASEVDIFFSTTVGPGFRLRLPNKPGFAALGLRVGLDESSLTGQTPYILLKSLYPFAKIALQLGSGSMEALRKGNSMSISQHQVTLISPEDRKGWFFEALGNARQSKAPS